MTDSRIADTLRALHDAGTASVCTRCPVCERNGKFSVTFRDDGLALYCCHRASCGVRGVYAIAGAANARESRKVPAFTPRPLTAPLRLPREGEYWAQYILHRIPADDMTLGAWCLRRGFRVLEDEPDTCAWTIRNVYRDVLGNTTRTRSKYVLSWFTSPLPRYGWWPKEQTVSVPILVVEDAMSAALWPGPAVALLGTNMSREVAAELARFAPHEHFYVALDADAIEKGQDVVARLRAAGAIANIQPLMADIKDMPPAERESMYRRMV